jgi:predicted metalloendopeptidase
MSAALAQSPLFDVKMPDSVNYGGMGFIVGHEFTHSLDNDGSKYDDKGEKRDWWDQRSKAEFQKRSKCFIRQYGKQQSLTTTLYSF